MTTLSFAKLHGTANDFIYVDAREGFPGHPAALAPRLCDRRRGVGADGRVLVVDDVAALPLAVLGPRFEHHPFFPRRVNTEFVRVAGRERLVMRVWERGAGETMACGTGACAVAVAAARTGRAARHVVVVLPGGELEIDWRDDDRVLMTGDAVDVFEGRIEV